MRNGTLAAKYGYTTKYGYTERCCPRQCCKMVVVNRPECVRGRCEGKIHVRGGCARGGCNCKSDVKGGCRRLRRIKGSICVYSNTSHLMQSAAWCIMLNFLFNSAVTWLW